MARGARVKVSSRFQIALPASVRRRLGIQAGDHLLVDVQDGVVILMPEPKDYAAAMAGLHREVWAGLDTMEYLDRERRAWLDSEPS